MMVISIRLDIADDVGVLQGAQDLDFILSQGVFKKQNVVESASQQQQKKILDTRSLAARTSTSAISSGSRFAVCILFKATIVPRWTSTALNTVPKAPDPNSSPSCCFFEHHRVHTHIYVWGISHRHLSFFFFPNNRGSPKRDCFRDVRISC